LADDHFLACSYVSPIRPQRNGRLLGSHLPRKKMFNDVLHDYYSRQSWSKKLGIPATLPLAESDANSDCRIVLGRYVRSALCGEPAAHSAGGREQAAITINSKFASDGPRRLLLTLPIGIRRGDGAAISLGQSCLLHENGCTIESGRQILADPQVWGRRDPQLFVRSTELAER